MLARSSATDENDLKKRAPLLAIAITLAACGLVSRDEVARVGSPDGRLDAVLVETNGGATTSFGYEIYVAEKGKSYRGAVATLYGAVRNDNASGANPRWRTDSELTVEYLHARAETLEKNAVRVAGRDVHIILIPGVSDPNAPAGGMFHNLERGRQPASQ